MPGGRPSTVTPDVAEEVCKRVANGESLRAICDDDFMPSYWSIFRALDADPSFASNYARARELQAEFVDHEIVMVARNSTPESAAADRVKLDAYKWRAARLAPKKYGDRLNVDQKTEVTTKEQFDGRHLSKAERQVFADLVAKMKKGGE
jgi:hypothetical protein